MKVSYWDLKGHVFQAAGAAKRKYQVLSVSRDKCQLVREDGQTVELVTDNLLDILNGKR